MKKVIIDTDPGVDDALAIILALKSTDIKVEAITVVRGNAELELCCGNLLKILTLIETAGKREVSRILLGKGSSEPLYPMNRMLLNYIGAEEVHGSDGLGDISYTDLAREFQAKSFQFHNLSAEDLILDLLVKYPGEITIIAIGPLTNIAKAIIKDREAFKKIKKLIVMGGALNTPGNTTRYSEFNFFWDPQAAKEVFNSGVPITMVGLDVTHKVILSRVMVMEGYKRNPSLISKFISRITDKYMQSHLKRDGFDGCYIHDALAVGVAIDKSFVKTENMAIEVDMEGEFRGKTKEVALDPHSIIYKKRVDVCLEVDTERFINFFFNRIYLEA